MQDLFTCLTSHGELCCRQQMQRLSRFTAGSNQIPSARRICLKRSCVSPSKGETYEIMFRNCWVSSCKLCCQADNVDTFDALNNWICKILVKHPLVCSWFTKKMHMSLRVATGARPIHTGYPHNGVAPSMHLPVGKKWNSRPAMVWQSLKDWWPWVWWIGWVDTSMNEHSAPMQGKGLECNMIR